MLRITFVCAVFPPEPEPAGVMARQLAEKLSSEGHEVTMVVPVPNRPGGSVYEGYTGHSRRIEIAPSGYKIVRCPHWLIGPGRRFINRILENATFGISSAWAAWRLGKPDVLIVETWPLFAVQCNAIVARLWRVPFVYYVQDVYPEAIEQVGMLKSESLLARILRSWDRRLCQSSAKMIVISRSMLEHLKETRGVTASHMKLISNWQDTAEFAEQQTSGNWRMEQQIPSTVFVAMFAGTLGHMSGAEFLVDVAARLREHKDILILCVGEGVQKEKMLEKAAALGLENIRFLPFQPRERLVEVQQSADVMLLTMRQGAADASIPSKLISYMAAGRGVLCAADVGLTVSKIVAKSDSGVVLRPEDSVAMASAILDLCNQPSEVGRMGRNARTYFEQNMTLDRAYEEVSDLLTEVTRSKAGSVVACREI